VELLNFLDFSEEQQLLVKFHQLIQKKLFLKNLQSCNRKEELQYYIKPKDKLEALHDKFIRFGTKKATSFIIIDVDNVNKKLNDFAKEVNYKLKDLKPNWILKTDKGFHIGFMLKDPIWLNNEELKQKAEIVKKNLTILLDGDIAGSHRLIGYWRNPLIHEAILNLDLHDLGDLETYTNELFFDSFNLFDDIKTNKEKIINKEKNKYQTAKTRWDKIDKTGFVKGNRNNFLFNKVVGMLYNGLITNNEVLTTLKALNNNELDDKEIQKIAKSILKYNIKPNKNKKEKKERKKRGEYSNDLFKHKIHNYVKNNKIEFERQRIGQKISTAKIIQNTINKLIKGYFKIYQNKEKFINENIVKNSNVSKRTIQRYRNDRKIENAIKTKAFIQYLNSLLAEGVMPNDTPINKILNLLIENLEYYYPKTKKTFKFKFNDNEKLIFYRVQSKEFKIAA